MKIRPVADPDFEAIAELTNFYIEGTAIHFGYEPVTAQELRDGWWPKRARYPYLVAVTEQGSLLGYAKAGVWRERAAYRWTAEVGIYVQPDSQGRGLGKVLYGQLVDECEARGLHSLVGGITLPNERSVRLHEALGFRKVAHFERAGWKFGRWHDVGFWQRMLAPAAQPAAESMP